MSSQVVSAQALRRTPEIAAFARLMRAYGVLRRELEAGVLQPRGLTINDFEALLHLFQAEDRRLRRIDLAERLMLSPSGVTRLLDGLQAAGLVANVHCESDARVTWAKLTDDGLQTLTVHLHPADLGPVSRIAQIRNGEIHLHLSGATEAGREALRAALPDLHRELRDAGFSTTHQGGTSRSGRASRFRGPVRRCRTSIGRPAPRPSRSRRPRPPAPANSTCMSRSSP